MTEHTHQAVAKQPEQENGLALISMILGIVSVAGSGLFLGIPAIITGTIALKKKLPGRSYALAGLITGIISTVLSILAIIFFAIIFFVGMSQGWNEDNNYSPESPRFYNMRS